MNNQISPELLAKLRSAEGEGLSRDPKNNPRKIVKLLQDKDVASKWCPFGARAGQYLIGDTLCDDFTWTPIKFLDTFIEWGVDGGGYVDTYYALPDDVKPDPKGRSWFRSNGNSVEKAADIIGLINREICRQSFTMGALAVARGLNAAAGTLIAESSEPVRLPFFGANWCMGSIEKPNSNGKAYWQPTYKLVGTVGQLEGPSWDDFDRCHRLCRLLTESITPAKSRTDSTNDNHPGPDAQYPPESDAPPPTGDDTPRSLADLEDIPF